MKGKVEPEQLWLAVRVLAGLGGSQRVDGLEAPLTGRDPELRTMKELFHAAAERRVPRLVVVSGPAGVGKSRLGWEFEKYIDGLADVVLWHRGRCLSYGEGVAFSALVEIVRQRLGIADEDPVDVAARKLADGVAQFVPDADEGAYVGTRLGRLLGLPFGDDDGAVLGRDELFAGWRLFFERLASTYPVVLIVEDAHYADAGLLDFCEHLVDWARDLPIFVLMFGRPEVEARRPRFGTGRNRTTLTIDPLDIASMGRLVDALVPGMPPAAATRSRRRRKEFRSSRSRPFGRSSTATSSSRGGRLPVGGRRRQAARPRQPARRCSLPGSTHSSRSRELGRGRRGARVVVSA